MEKVIQLGENNISGENANIVTILMPNYNNETYIIRALDSIIEQVTEYEYEILIIDDCSTDNSVSIVENYMRKHPNKQINLYKNENNMRCLGTTLRGYELVKTKYFTVLDPDDYWISKNKLQKAIGFLEQHPEYTIYASDAYLKKNSEKKVYMNLPSMDIEFEELGKKMIFCHTSATFFRTVFTKGELIQLASYIGTPEEKCFEGDTFRNYFHLNKGKCHIDSSVESVYNITNDGIWTGLSEKSQKLLNMKIYISFFEYFKYKKPDFFLQVLKKFFDEAISDLDKNNADEQCQEIVEMWIKYMAYINQSKFNFLNKHKDIVFFFPSRSIGGYETLFIRMAKYLTEKLKFNVHYIDYGDGFAAKELGECDVNVIHYEENMQCIDILKPFYLITSLTFAYQVPVVKNKASKILFWVAHPKTYEWTMIRAGLNNRRMQDFIKVLSNNKAMAFMDKACLHSIKGKCDVDIQEIYTPVMLEEKLVSQNMDIIQEKKINIAWLGRLDEDKIYSVINLLENLEKYKTSFKKAVHVVGDGEAKKLIDVYKYKNVEIIFTGILMKEELDNYLIDNVDILFAMGTSMLEGASLKLPVVMTPLKDDDCYNDDFYWLYNMQKFILGFYSVQSSELGMDKYKISFMKVMDEIYVYDRKTMYAEYCYKYFLKNHSMDASMLKFVYSLYNTNLDYNKCITDSSDQEKKKQIFYSKKEGIYKRIGLLGYEFRIIRPRTLLKEYKEQKVFLENIANSQNEKNIEFEVKMQHLQDKIDSLEHKIIANKIM